MVVDHEKRPKGREYHFMSDFSNEQLIEKAENAENKVRMLQGYIERWRGIVHNRVAKADRNTMTSRSNAAEEYNKSSETKDVDDDPELLFLADDTTTGKEAADMKSQESAPPAAKTLHPFTTPRQPTMTPFGTNSSTFILDCSPNFDCKLRPDQVKAWNNKLTALIEANTPEDLQLWLEYTGWFDEDYKHAKLELLKRKEEIDHATAALEFKAKELGGNKRPSDKGNGAGNVASRIPPSEAVERIMYNTNHSTASASTDTNLNRNFHDNNNRRPESGQQGNWDARHYSAPNPRSYRRERNYHRRRSRSPSPSYARGQRYRPSQSEDPVDPRRGSSAVRRPRSPASPPLRGNQRISPRPVTPPRRGGIVVGTSGGWGKKGGYDYGHGW